MTHQPPGYNPGDTPEGDALDLFASQKHLDPQLLRYSSLGILAGMTHLERAELFCPTFGFPLMPCGEG